MDKLIKNLENNGFECEFFQNKQEASEYILSLIKPGYRVGMGGSQTLNELDLKREIIEKQGILLDHGVKDITMEEKLDIMRQQQVCDVFLTSTNAITEKGELVNIDGNGNRVSAMIFGPKRVVVVLGINKICKDESAAFERIAKISAPLNNKRLKTLNPCTITGYCMDCQCEKRICRAYSVIKKRPNFTPFTVVIINEELGF